MFSCRESYPARLNLGTGGLRQSQVTEISCRRFGHCTYTGLVLLSTSINDRSRLLLDLSPPSILSFPTALLITHIYTLRLDPLLARTLPLSRPSEHPASTPTPLMEVSPLIFYSKPHFPRVSVDDGLHERCFID
jgi:hypothetical protein